VTITSVRVTPIDQQKALAIVSVTLCDCFVLRAMRLMEGRRRRYVAMPTRQTQQGGLFEVYHPINAETRETLERVVIETYERRLTGIKDEGVPPVFLGTDCSDFLITAVRVKPYEELKLKGFATMVLDNCLAINGIKIIAGKRRSFIQMPNVKKKSGKFRDLAFPTQTEVRDLIERTVFEEYEKAIAED
jgi:stage V sporulation protein G